MTWLMMYGVVSFAVLVAGGYWAAGRFDADRGDLLVIFAVAALWPIFLPIAIGMGICEYQKR